MCCGFADHLIQWSEMCLLGKVALVLVTLASSAMFGTLLFLLVRHLVETLAQATSPAALEEVPMV